MGKVSILVMWPWPFEVTFVPPGTIDAYLNYKLANEPSAKLSWMDWYKASLFLIVIY